MKMARLDLDELRTLIVNGITGMVAFGLAVTVLKNREIEPRPWPANAPAPFIETIIPARNEAANVQPLLATLLRQEYPRDSYRVTVVDGSPTDRTGALADELAARYRHLRVLATLPLPHGWTGKNHAFWTGASQAAPDADRLLFVDADTRHHPLMLASVVQRAQEVHADLLSLVIGVRLESFWQRAYWSHR
jgi:chlorobactene glucosyltransferase